MYQQCLNAVPGTGVHSTVLLYCCSNLHPTCEVQNIFPLLVFHVSCDDHVSHRVIARVVTVSALRSLDVAHGFHSSIPADNVMMYVNHFVRVASEVQTHTIHTDYDRCCFHCIQFPIMTLLTRPRALSLYRQLLRGAMKMPTPNRQNFILRKTRTEFRANRHLTDLEDIDFHLRLADTNLDTVLVQAEHLTKLMRDPNYLMEV
jgi:Complex 1 protein (LYR family)